MNRSIVVVDAPSNLGCNPPSEGVVPGVYKLAGALRDRGLLTRLHARDGGVVTPPRYASLHTGEGYRNAQAIASYSQALAVRLSLNDSEFHVVLGGDCTVLFGVFAHLGKLGNFGLLLADAHSGFRPPTKTELTTAAAQDGLTILTGNEDSKLMRVVSNEPFVLLPNVVMVGLRESDPSCLELKQLGAFVFTTGELDFLSPERAARSALERMCQEHLDGFWVHFDADVIDASEMPAVETPEPGGPSFDYMTAFLRAVLRCDRAVGISVTIYDPDLDPEAVCAERLAEMLANIVTAVQ